MEGITLVCTGWKRPWKLFSSTNYTIQESTVSASLPDGHPVYTSYKEGSATSQAFFSIVNQLLLLENFS